MNAIIIGLSVYLLVVVLFQAVLVHRYCRWLRRPHFSEDGLSADVAVILSVRGLDPSLPACLQGLADQEYMGTYKVHIIVDHFDDDAYETVSEFIARLNESNFEMIVGDLPLGTCSLKCDRLIQVIDRLEDSVEIVCLIDADTVPDRRWLTSLVAPLNEPKVACASGNRWFYPPAGSGFGDLVRYLWNSAAVVQMYTYGIAWGGSMAIRHQALKDTELLEAWSKSLFDDVLVKDHFESHGLEFVSIRELLLANQEQTSWQGSVGWIKRQLLDAKLYHRKWPLVLLHAISSSFLWAAILGLVGLSLLSGNMFQFAASLILLAVILGGNFVLLLTLEKAANANINQRLEWLGQTGKPWLNFRRVLLMILGVPLVQVVFCYSAIWAATTRTVTWRKCCYVVQGKHEIEMVDYEPYESMDEAVEQSVE